jgi:hypothetical protein
VNAASGARAYARYFLTNQPASVGHPAMPANMTPIAVRTTMITVSLMIVRFCRDEPLSCSSRSPVVTEIGQHFRVWFDRRQAQIRHHDMPANIRLVRHGARIRSSEHYFERVLHRADLWIAIDGVGPLGSFFPDIPFESMKSS